MPPADPVLNPAARPAPGLKYRAVAAELVERIHRGAYRPGDLLPSEPHLTREFEVSRHTIRAALRALQEQGLVSSQRGRGSVVQSTSPSPRYRQICDSVEDILQYAETSPRRVMQRRRVVADAALASQLGCPAGYPWWEIHTRRQQFPEGPAIASSLIWVPEAFAAAAAELEDTDQPLFVLLERLHGCHFAEIRQTVSVARACAREATDLGLAPETPVLCVERRFFDERGGLLELSRTVHSAETFRFESTLRRVLKP